MSTPVVFNFQRFSTHDGPGLRSTIFFKGCPLRCPWCHNPESWHFEPEMMPQLNGRMELVGRSYSVAQLVSLVEADQLFYDMSGGGVTLSGGEPMVQDFTFLTELVTTLRQRGLDLAIDTCGVAPARRFDKMAGLASRFLYDLKFIRDDDHRRWTGLGNGLVLENLRLLSGLGAVIHLRLILIDQLNTAEGTIDQTMLWLKANDIAVVEVNLLPYHRFGLDKAARLGRTPREFSTPAPGTIERITTQVRAYFDHVTVGG